MSEPVSLIWTVKSLFESPNIDDDVTRLETKFHPGGAKARVVDMEIDEETGLLSRLSSMDLLQRWLARLSGRAAG